jgi:hypothetical protein
MGVLADGGRCWSRPSSFQKGFLGKNEKQFVYLGKKRRALGLGAHQGNW